MRKTILRWIFVDVLILFPMFFFQLSTAVKVVEDLISFPDILVFTIGYQTPNPRIDTEVNMVKVNFKAEQKCLNEKYLSPDLNV